MNKFVPSINILNDSSSSNQYIVTENVKIVTQQIINDYKLGIRVFNIIGSYGTGKSAYLLNFYYSLTSDILGIAIVFDNHRFDAIKVVGSFESFPKVIAEAIGLNQFNNYSEVLQALEGYLVRKQKENKGVIFLIDEMGKFLEYASQNIPENELYFFQNFAELLNGDRFCTLMISTLHQNFDAYSKSLNFEQKQEWYKVKGRFKEISFNEPIENLISLISNRLQSKFDSQSISLNKSDIIVFNNSRILDRKRLIAENDIKLIYPFDFYSIELLVKSLQLYGQNERSLFNFIESNDYLGLNWCNWSDGMFFNIESVYDYLHHNYHSMIFSKDNPFYLQWAAISSSCDRVESSFELHRECALSIVKIIGMLNIFANKGAMIHADFIKSYVNSFFRYTNKATKTVLEELENKKIIRYLAFKTSYILFEGTDLNIDVALNDAANKISVGDNFVDKLSSYINLYPIIAKEAFLKTGTPRFFDYNLSVTPITSEAIGEHDGFINLVFSENNIIDNIVSISENMSTANAYCYFLYTKDIRAILFQLEKVNYVIMNVANEDKVATKELKNMQLYFKEQLRQTISSSLFDSSKTTWIINGQKESVPSPIALNRLLSNLTYKIFPSAPIFANEMVNREQTSSAVSTAWKKLLDNMINFSSTEDFGFEHSKFPLEKTIYLTLLQKSGIHKKTDDGFELSAPTDSSYLPVWNVFCDFVKSSQSRRRSLSDLISIFSTKPYKLKRGLIDFVIPVFLYIKRNEFALYGDDAYIPQLSTDTFQLIKKQPHKYHIKAFNVEGVRLEVFNKYREFLKQSSLNKISNETFIEAVKPFLIFYNSLPAYSKSTNKLSKQAIRLRRAIADATDPEKVFFEDIPAALGVSLETIHNYEAGLEDYIKNLEAIISEIRGCFDNLINRVEYAILDSFGNLEMTFPDYKKYITSRYSLIKDHLLTSNQKIFLNRLKSNIDDRVAWLSAIAQPAIGKRLEQIQDTDEELMLDNIRHIINSLDSYRMVLKKNKNIDNEYITVCRLHEFNHNGNDEIFNLPKHRQPQLSKLIDNIEKLLDKDNSLNKMALAKLLMRKIDEDK